MISKAQTHKFSFHRNPLDKKCRLLQKTTIGLGLLLAIWFVFTTITLVSASSKPVDAFFVLGGSINREIYVAKLTKKYPLTRTLISQGSPDPCIWLIFQREAVQITNVWLEQCANSTFGNFYYGLPILQSWNVHKVKLITSLTHLPRAKWMAQVLFGAHGIWIETEIVPEQGIPGNQEYWLKTGVDVSRTVIWAGLSQLIYPQCLELKKLADVDMEAWQNTVFKCERQGNFKSIYTIY